MIPIKPISINQCWQGRRFMTPEYKEWRKCVVAYLKTNYKKVEAEFYEVNIKLYLKSIVVSDCDNFIKPVFDSLVEAGIIKDDRYILKLSIEKIKSKEEGFDIIIY